MATVQWSGIEDIQRNLDVYAQKIHDAMVKVADYFAPVLETEAKNGAPWTDRTGNARQELNGFTEDVSMTVVEIYLAHKMDYGVWLELKNSGRYAIILPTIEKHYAAIFSMLQGVFA
jgi:hypothetical protein